MLASEVLRNMAAGGDTSLEYDSLFHEAKA